MTIPSRYQNGVMHYFLHVVGFGFLRLIKVAIIPIDTGGSLAENEAI